MPNSTLHLAQDREVRPEFDITFLNLGQGNALGINALGWFCYFSFFYFKTASPLGSQILEYSHHCLNDIADKLDLTRGIIDSFC